MSLEVRNLCFAHGRTRILHDCSFSAAKGQFTVLLGPNGAGKSTLFKILAGILPVDSGYVRIDGEDPARVRNADRARLIGYLPQFHEAVFPFSVEDVVLTGRAAYVCARPSKTDRRRAMAAIERMGIAHLKTRAYTDLSGGERQLVMIARVLAQEPGTILLDEPISHLDLAHQQMVLRIVREIAASAITVIAVLHDPNAAMLHADSVLFLKEGRIAARPKQDGPLLDSGFIKTIYGIRADVIAYGDKGIVVPLPEEPHRQSSSDQAMDDRELPQP